MAPKTGKHVPLRIFSNNNRLIPRKGDVVESIRKLI